MRVSTYSVKYFFGMSCGQAKPGSGLNNWSSRKSHHNYADIPLQHLPSKGAARGKQGKETRKSNKPQHKGPVVLNDLNS